MNQLRLTVPDVKVDFDPVTGSPVFISSQSQFLTRATTAPARAALPHPQAVAIIRGFIEEQSSLFGHGGDLLDDAVVQRDFLTAHNGLRTIVWAQQFEGIPLFESILIAHTTKNGELVNLSSKLIPDSARAAGPDQRLASLEPPITAAQAVARATANVGESQTKDDIVTVGTNANVLQLKASTIKGVADVQKVWLPMSPTEMRLCWEVLFTSQTRDELFRVLVDALTGEVKVRHCLTEQISNATYRVFTSDSPSPFSPGQSTPLTSQPAVVARTLVVTNAYSTNASPNGWINDGENETLGNNVDAHLDRNGDNLPDLPRPQGSPFRIFDFPLDLSQSPTNYQPAAVVQLFFWCNWMHDKLYELGFTEAAGNFQMTNFDRGGVGGDPVLADAQDGSGSNNANFSTPPDGRPGRMQMFLWTGATPNRSGELDAEIVLHEYGHGLSNRRVGGGVGITAFQSRGMGEGWSDFCALSLLSEPGDDPNGNYAAGAYVFYSANFANYYYGVRRYPYTTDMAKNPLTFKDIDPVRASQHTGVPVALYGQANEVHDQGEVWCVTLWEARANLIAKLGGAVGNQLMLQLVVDGMNLSPPNPSFLQARDAILQAELLDCGGTNAAALWAAFAKRGMGVSATCPPSSAALGVCESFDQPGELVIAPFNEIFVAGKVGGPFTGGSRSLTFTNTGTNTITWAAGKSANWTDMSLTGGLLSPGQAATVTLSCNATTSNLLTGFYTDMLLITNLSSGVVYSLPIELETATFASIPFTENWESGSFGPYWLVSGAQTYRTRLTTLNSPRGVYHVMMDSSGGLYSINEVTLGLDLQNCTNVVLSVYAKEFAEEADVPFYPVIDHGDFDGIAISQDGIHWYQAQSFVSLGASYRQLTVYLDECVRANSLHYNSTFRIRFNQYDNAAINTDGIAIDDISVTGKRLGELDHFAVSAVASPQTSGIPFRVTLEAKDAAGVSLTNFTNSVAFTARSGPTNLTLFGDDFEDGDFSDWINGSGPYVRAITNETAAVGTNSFTLIGGTGNSRYNGISHTLANLKPDRINFRVRTAANDKFAGYFGAGTGPSDSSMAIFFFMTSSGTMGVVEDVGGFSHLTNYQSNQWYRISLALDWINRQMDFYADDQLIERNIPFRNQTVSSLTQLYLYNFNFAQSWWDAIELLTNNTPPAISIFPSNSAQFVNGVWSGYVTVQPPGTNVFLTVSDGNGHSGIGNSFVLATFPDADGDGMPDDWELAHSLNPNNSTDASTDLDGDGASNLQEYLAGTNPNDPADSLRILSVTLLSGGDVQLTFSTVASRYYRLERTDNLESGVWSVATDLIPGTGSPLNVFDPGGAAQAKRFYRIRLLP